jgi:lysophospholipase L1-like esterase
MVERLVPDDPRLRWYGAISFERGASSEGEPWIKPWRIPFEQRLLFGRISPPDMLLSRAGMPAGVRIAFHSDTEGLAGQLEPLAPDLFAVEQAQAARIDVCCDGALHASTPLLDRTDFVVDGLPRGNKLVEVWLPEYREIRLRRLALSDGASVRPYEDMRPRWLIYGSSNTQSRGAESPIYTWPAVVARRCGLNHTNVAYGGECHLDSMVARMMRGLPAHLITMEVGINIYINGTLNARAIRAALIGFVQIVREGHPDTPLAVVSSFYSAQRETTPNSLGLTLPAIREVVAEAVASLRSSGDTNTHYVAGLDLFGEDMAPELPDQLHPSAEGYKILGARFAERVVPRLLPGAGAPGGQ